MNSLNQTCLDRMARERAPHFASTSGKPLRHNSGHSYMEAQFVPQKMELQSCLVLVRVMCHQVIRSMSLKPGLGTGL